MSLQSIRAFQFGAVVIISLQAMLFSASFWPNGRLARTKIWVPVFKGKKARNFHFVS
jgi:hypothetical protein